MNILEITADPSFTVDKAQYDTLAKIIEIKENKFAKLVYNLPL